MDSKTVKNVGMDPGTTLRPQKLKDSCDTCSASKIRCDKQKPLCGRCSKLGYPCFYSPARRMGHARRESASTDAASALETKEASQGGETAGETVGPLQHTLQPQKQKRLRSRTPPPNYGLSTPGQPMNTLARQHLNRLTTSGPDGWSYSTTTTKGRTFNLMNASNSNGNASNEAAKDPGTGSMGSSSASSTSGGGVEVKIGISGGTDSRGPELPSDCASLAMDMLLQLEVARAKLQSASNGANHHSTGPESINGLQNIQGDNHSHAAIKTVAVAFRSLSAILVCPCSESPHVGLLAAAVCLAMLDVYSVIIGRSNDPYAGQKVQVAPVSDSSCMMVSIEEETLNWDGSNHSSDNNVSINNKKSLSSSSHLPGENVVRVLGELTKVARVVLQFTKRYYWDGDVEENSHDFLQALATLLRSRLHSVTAEATV